MPTLKVLDTYPGWEKLEVLPLKPAKEHEPPLREGQLFVVVGNGVIVKLIKAVHMLRSHVSGSFIDSFVTRSVTELARIPEYDYTAETPADFVEVVIANTKSTCLRCGANTEEIPNCNLYGTAYRYHLCATKKQPLTFTTTREQEITDSDGIKYERNKITLPNWKATGEFTPEELREHLKLGRRALGRQVKQFSK